MNNKTLIIIACVVGALLLLIVPTCSSYNTMNSLQKEADAKWAEVQNNYQRRFDLIPNLVETVKAFAKHERETLQGVTEARTGIVPSDSAMMSAMAAAKNPNLDPVASNNAQQAFERQFSIYVNAVHEAYPQLTSSENFMKLQDELTGTENKVAYARKNYVDAVQQYNTKISSFPATIVAGMFGFQPKPQFEAQSEAQSAPKVQF